MSAVSERFYGSIYDVSESDEVDLIREARGIDRAFDAEDGTDRTIYQQALDAIADHERPTTYLVAKKAGLTPYLGFDAHLVRAGAVAAIVAVPDEHATWQRERLWSGLMALGPETPRDRAHAEALFADAEAQALRRIG